MIIPNEMLYGLRHLSLNANSDVCAPVNSNPNSATSEKVQKRRIARIIARLNVGGPARHVVWLTEALQDENFESVLIAGRVPEGEEDMAYFAGQHGVEPVFIEDMSRELSFRDISALIKIWRELREFKPDVVHTHTAKAGSLGRVATFFYKWFTPTTLIGRPRKVRVFHTFHGHIFHGYYGPLKTKLFLTIEKILGGLATDRVIAISRIQAAEIGEKYRVVNPNKIDVIPLGLDLKGFSETGTERKKVRDELGVGSNETVVGIVGRLTEIKNHSLFIDIARIFNQNSDFCRARFVVIGDGHLRSELEEYAKESGVIFAGNRTDGPGFYDALDIVVLTSENEGTPLTLIEAMASGVPWVATSVGGVPDLAGPLKTESDQAESAGNFRICERGILAEAGDARGLAEGLNALIGDTELMKGLGVNGKSFVTDNYSKNRLVKDIEELYRMSSN
ncbi:MAG: glycosyltransferase [Pyrinomonadaceae bacterium]|nr:glycosyltransferase [Pyrinomonadaceae bacterium]